MFLLHALILGTLDFLGSVLVDSFKIFFSSLSSSLRGMRELSIKTRQNKTAEVKTEKYVRERDPPYP